jgi:ubiquitin
VPIQATAGNQGKPDPEASESKHEEKQFRETVLPSGKIEHETTQGRADVGDVPTAETSGRLAREVLSNSRHAESRERAPAVLQLLAGSKNRP